jgi:hypothetical protein
MDASSRHESWCGPSFRVSVALGGLGALGPALFAIWLVVVGFRLITLPLAARPSGDAGQSARS